MFAICFFFLSLSLPLSYGEVPICLGIAGFAWESEWGEAGTGFKVRLGFLSGTL